MTRKLFIAGNWKMNMDASSSVALVKGLKEQLSSCENANSVDVAVCPPFVYLAQVAEAAKGSNIAVGSQDVYFEEKGAFTGEISTSMLKDIGCSFALVGHSERRHVIGETNDILNKKIKASLAGGLDVVFCIGELLEEREAGDMEKVLEDQVKNGLEGITAKQMANITVAYEPVWAIGTGKTASKEQAQEAHAFVRGLLTGMFGEETAQAVRIQYGGSVKGSNAAELTAQTDVDGALVGGASLKVEDFMGIIQNSVQSADNGDCGCSCNCGC